MSEGTVYLCCVWDEMIFEAWVLSLSFIFDLFWITFAIEIGDWW